MACAKASLIPVAVDIHIDLFRGFALVTAQRLPFFECFFLNLVSVPFNIARVLVQPVEVVLLFLGLFRPDVIVTCIFRNYCPTLRLIRDAIS